MSGCFRVGFLRCRSISQSRASVRRFSEPQRRIGFKIVESWGSPGVGRALHEAPERIPGSFDAADKRIQRGHGDHHRTVSTKSRMVTEASDGLTLVGGPGNLSAQYEQPTAAIAACACQPAQSIGDGSIDGPA
jgi:hypothetical protein